MKTKFYWFALLASAALIAQAQAGGHHGGGGFAGGGGGHISSRAGGPSYHSMSRANFGGGGRFAAPGPRFSAMGGRYSSNAFRQPYINGGAAFGPRQFTGGHFNRGSYVTRFGNSRDDRLAQVGNGVNARNAAVGNRGAQVRNGNNLPANWRNHVAGQRSADWHRGWDRNHDHFWHGHRCRFVDGSWLIFDLGFPWYGYPYDYYADDYYSPYQYDAGVYEGDDGDYYGQSAYESPDEYADSTVSAAQAQLSGQGYYQGRIDGVYGAATRRAVMRYQSNHGLRVTGSLNTDTLQALGLPRVANN